MHSNQMPDTQELRTTRRLKVNPVVSAALLLDGALSCGPEAPRPLKDDQTLQLPRWTGYRKNGTVKHGNTATE